MDGGTHRGEIDEQRHASEILQHDAGDDEGDFVIAGGFRVVVREVVDVPVGNFQSVVIAEQGFEHDPDRDGELGKVREFFRERGEGMEFALFAGAGGESADVAHVVAFFCKKSSGRRVGDGGRFVKNVPRPRK